MRAAALLFLLAACSKEMDLPGELPDASPTACPEAVVAGGTCVLPADLWCTTSGDVCGLSWGTSSFAPCHCVDGHFACDDLYPFDGAACPYPDEVSCSREGPPSCDPIGQPSGAYCTCSPTTGTWICDDSQWCDCPATYRPSIDGSACTFTTTCTYPDHTCTCDVDTITCTSP